MLPKPEVLLLTDTATVPKSANTKSILPNAAHDPRSSKLESLNSFTQTSASIRFWPEVFSKAIKIPRISPKFGFPITEYVWLLACTWLNLLLKLKFCLSLSILSFTKSVKLKFISFSKGHTSLTSEIE